MSRFSIVLAALLPLGYGQTNPPEPGCTYPGPCVNPVPAVDISVAPQTSVWQDDYGEQWTISSDAGGNVTGTVYVPNNSLGYVCGSWTFDVSGSIAGSLQTDGIQGYTLFTLTTSNPSPSGPLCGVYPEPTEFSGTVQNDGNDKAANVSWSYVGGGGSGTTNFTKLPSDVPVSETTMAVGFSSGPGATQGQFRQILNASNGSGDIFKGRQIQEYTGFGSPDYDNCWWPASPVQKWTSVLGSLWNVGYYAINPPFITSDNEWSDDYIGWSTVAVSVYRQHWATGSPLCGARVPQAMYIAVSGTSGNQTYYSGGTVGEDIYTDHVTAWRDGISQSANQ